MKFGGDITMQGAAPGDPITVLDSWDPRPAGASDGDFYSMSGSIYRYDSTFGFLVRPIIYEQTTKTLDGYITGSEGTWPVNVGGGAWTGTGGSTADGWTTIKSGRYWIGPGSGAAGNKGWYAAGYLRSNGAPTVSYKGIGMICAANGRGHWGFSAYLLADATDPDPNFVAYPGGTSGTGEIGVNTTPSGSTFDLTVSDPPWFEFYLPQDIVVASTNGGMAWIGHSKIPIKISNIRTGNIGSYASNRWLIGDGTSGAASISIKNFSFGKVSS